MTRTMTALLAFVFSAAGFATPAQNDPAAASAHAGHGAHDATVVAPPEGRLWPTDEPLRTGMSRIETAVAQATAAPHPVSRERSRALARVVEENVNYIVKNCKLPPEPDAALHVLIGRMLAARNGLDNEASSEAAVAELAGVVHDYRATFDHSQAASPHHH